MSAVFSQMQDRAAIEALRQAAAARCGPLLGASLAEARRLWERLPDPPATAPALDRAAVTIGADLAEDDPARIAIAAMARALMPWKKGPFRLFGIDLDAEWRADFKWERLAGSIGSLAGQNILDIGCNNGYFMFRAAAHGPRLVLGIDPAPRVCYQFRFLQRYARLPNLEIQPWGWQEVAHWQTLFDTVFCMGILYHHSDPIRILKDIHRALRPGGLLVLETIVIPGVEPHCLLPPDR